MRGSETVSHVCASYDGSILIASLLIVKTGLCWNWSWLTLSDERPVTLSVSCTALWKCVSALWDCREICLQHYLPLTAQIRRSYSVNAASIIRRSHSALSPCALFNWLQLKAATAANTQYWQMCELNFGILLNCV